MDVRSADGTLAPRWGKPFREARTLDSGSRASRRSEGPSGRDLERLEQRKGRQSRKGRWRQRKRKKGEGKAQKGLEEDIGPKRNSSISSIDAGRECPEGDMVVTERGEALDAQGRNTDSTAAALGDRGRNPGRGIELKDEVTGAQLKRQTTDLAGALFSARSTTNRGLDPDGAEVEDVPFPPLPPCISPSVLLGSAPPGVDARPSGVDILGQSPARRSESGKGLCGKRLWEMGEDLVEEFRRVSPLTTSISESGCPSSRASCPSIIDLLS